MVALRITFYSTTTNPSRSIKVVLFYSHFSFYNSRNESIVSVTDWIIYYVSKQSIGPVIAVSKKSLPSSKKLLGVTNRYDFEKSDPLWNDERKVWGIHFETPSQGRSCRILDKNKEYLTWWFPWYCHRIKNKHSSHERSKAHFVEGEGG